MTNVIHIRNAPKDWEKLNEYVYIGRAGKGLSGYFGNPFRDGTRAEIVKYFREYFERQLLTNEVFAAKVLDLQGKTLVCFCKPLLCHGDVIVEYLDGKTEQTA